MLDTRKVDLHVHSNVSDGTDTPEQLVSLAVSVGLSAFALTDHDTIGGIDAALQEAEKVNSTGVIGGNDNDCNNKNVMSTMTTNNTTIEVIPGVELSTHFERSEIHIVGLFIDHTNDELCTFLETQLQSRITRNINVCKAFQSLGIDINYDDMCEAYPGAVLTRAHFADRLVKLHICGDRNEAFERFLSPSKPCYIKREKVNPETAIRIIHQSGGVAVLAHPILYHLGNEQMKKLLDCVCGAGIDAIEALYSTYTAGDERLIRSIASERNLLISGGSDYHGNNKPHISLGTGMGHLYIPYEVLEKLRIS